MKRSSDLESNRLRNLSLELDILKQKEATLRKRVEDTQEKSEHISGEIDIAAQNIYVIIFFGITVSFAVNLFASIIHEHYKNLPYYECTITVILILLLIIGGKMLLKIYLEPIKRKLDVIKKPLNDLNREQK